MIGAIEQKGSGFQDYPPPQMQVAIQLASHSKFILKFLSGSVTSQGVVTYVSHVHVEAFVIEIKIEPSDQCPFLGTGQGIKVASKLLKLMYQECMTAI